MSGIDAIKGIHEIKLPCIWALDPANVELFFGHHIHHILNEVEKLRGGRFHQQVHRQRFTSTHALLRILLGQLLAMKAEDITFENGRHNKPMLTSGPYQTLYFNLSYTNNQALIAIDNITPIGIDIEWLNKAFDYQDMQEVCFSKREIEYIDLNRPDATQRFFTLWTRKEAILKLTGEGINEYLNAFEVLDGGSRAQKGVIGDAPPDNIHIYSFKLGVDYVGSIATSRPQIAINFYQF